MSAPARSAPSAAAAGPPAPRGWYAWLLGGLAPLLVGGFLASALADRLVFVAWGLAAAAAWAAALRGRWERGRGVALGVLAVAIALFALLAVRHAEELRHGLAAVGPVTGEAVAGPVSGGAP